MSGDYARGLWESFKSAWSAVVGVVALVLSVALWTWAPNVRVSLGLVIPVGTAVLVVLLIAVLTLIEATLKIRDRVKEVEKDRDLIRAEYADYKAASGLPEVVEGREPFAGTKGELLCFLRSSALFSPEILISFFRVGQQDLEEPIGIGVVFNVQENGIIQALMTKALEGHEEFIERLKRNEGEAVRTTRVKPTVSRSHANL